MKPRLALAGTQEEGSSLWNILRTYSWSQQNPGLILQMFFGFLGTVT